MWGLKLGNKLFAFMHGQFVLGIDKAEYVLLLLFILILLEFNNFGDEVGVE